jgi:hypothetical protein
MESMEKEQEKPNPIIGRVNIEAELLRGDLLLEDGEWEKALHVYLAERDEERIMKAAAKFKSEGNKDAYVVAVKHMQLLRKSRPGIDN